MFVATKAAARCLEIFQVDNKYFCVFCGTLFCCAAAVCGETYEVRAAEQQRHRMPSCSNEVRCSGIECRGAATKSVAAASNAVVQQRSPLQRHGMPCYKVRWQPCCHRLFRNASVCCIVRRSIGLRTTAAKLSLLLCSADFVHRPLMLQNRVAAFHADGTKFRKDPVPSLLRRALFFSCHGTSHNGIPCRCSGPGTMAAMRPSPWTDGTKFRRCRCLLCRPTAWNAVAFCCISSAIPQLCCSEDSVPNFQQ